MTTDVVLIRASDRKIALVKRRDDPFRGMWALPGGFVDQDEDLPDAARRELEEETGIVCDSLEQFRAYGTPGRDPRGHTVSIVFIAETENRDLSAGDDADEAGWWPLDELPELAFDHARIVSEATERAKEKGWLKR